MLCVKYAVEKGFDDICLVGGMGGRLDHTISNLQSMAWAIDFWNLNRLKGKKISMSDCQNHVMLIMDDSIILSGTPGEKISLLSYSENCINVTTGISNGSLQMRSLPILFRWESVMNF